MFYNKIDSEIAQVNLKGAKMSKTINKIIGLSILVVSAVILAFALSGCNNEKKVVGNWHIKSFAVNAKTQDLFGDNVLLLKKNNIEDSKASVFTFKEDKTFEQSIFGKLISGTYAIDGDKLKISPTSDNKGKLPIFN